MALRSQTLLAGTLILGLATDCFGQVADSTWTKIPNSSFQIYAGDLSLSADGIWKIESVDNIGIDRAGIRERYLTPTQSMLIKRLGRRMLAAEKEKQTAAGRWALSSAYHASRDYAQERDGVGPETIASLGEEDYGYLIVQWEKMPWRGKLLTSIVDEEVTGPFRFLVPNARFHFENPDESQERFVVSQENREILAVELRPFVDDGKHWVVYTDGTCVREKPNAKLFRQHALQLRPVISDAILREAQNRQKVGYEVCLVSDKPIEGTVQLNLYNSVLRQRHSVVWDLGTAQPDSKGTDRLKKARKNDWQPFIATGGGAILESWLNVSSGPAEARRGAAPSMFSVLGGRAAIEETLQLQDLGGNPGGGEATVEIDTIAGVEVSSHPFEDMLGGAAGGRIELARFVPHDRFFLYVAKPSVIHSFLGSGASFLSDAGAVISGNRLDYDLANRYLERLGLDENLVRTILETDLLEDLAVSTSDLLLIDGTDITIVARLKQPKLLSALVGFMGPQVVQRDSGSGSAYWTLRQDLLIVSTNRSELQQTIDLVEREGEGSLGASAEFRYMLTELPMDQETQLYAYCSDPFIRRLVGPRVKLGQRRRLIAKARLEATTAQVLLAKLDGRQIDTIEALANSGYIPPDWNDSDLTLSPRGIVSSQKWGSLERMRSLQDVPLEKVTPEEERQYKRYVENYSRYWREFFDPIAIRLSQKEDESFELTTFILPLIDSSLYNGLRQFLAHGTEQQVLAVPRLSPKPILNFSVNLREEAWTEVANNFSDFFSQYSGVSSAILDDLGSGVHVAIHDADPILALGSGDALGAFGGNAWRGGNEMLMIPIALSVFTRPCTILVETRDPEQTARYLRLSAAGGGQSSTARWFRSAFYQVEDRDEWVWTMDFSGVAKLRFGVQVADNYLVIRNVPWSQHQVITSTEQATLNGAQLTIHPGACHEQLPGLHAAAADSNRQSVLSGISRLYPILLASPSSSTEEAREHHKELFSFAPRLLATDQWTWSKQRLSSLGYGTPTQPKQPAFDSTKPFGLLGQVETVDLNMQFEDGGLRSRVTWTLREAEAQ